MSLDFGPRRDAAEYLGPAHKFILDHFYNYGRELVALLRHAANSSRGLQALAQQLGERVDYDDIAQLEILARFIRKYGAEVFLQRLGKRKHESELLESRTVVVSQKQSTPATPDGSCPDGQTGSDHFDPSGKYVGPERRNDQERRQLKRRTECEAIEKNKRFGGDRRKRGRRIND